ncbi:chromosome partitioning protein [Micromonospora narathiwatensis]|uniref:MinD-like ATPase involved in chromosome partitioning or flagellar assembly n=1 Tax=Micromonospora narathiwatensis TaxID=299146 RepID=A0A1A9AC32_9ACTN|nr:chromosome partitioning protein [Micromonospora narathiwatensis]SBT53693.1 MinD-like ATPase involved in chromosome partitioning or flagellar assembly [Micromonospora narathiwatensis]
MVHENADRAHVRGQPQVPERDIEPLWPPDPTDPDAAVPPWAAPQPAAPAWPTPPATTPTARPPTPQPVDPSGEPAPDQIPPDAGNGTPVARTVQPSVDLDLPFTLDQPPAGPDSQTPPSSRAAIPPTTGGEAAGAAIPATADETVAEAAVPADGSGPVGDGATGGGRSESPWAQPPQRLTNPASEPSGRTPASPPVEAAAGPVTPPAAGTASPGPDVPVTAPVPGGPDLPAAGAVEATGGRGSPQSPPRLGPFPPAPGVPLRQPPYGDGTAYPPGPVGYGPPGHPSASAYPAHPQAGGPTPPPGWYPPAWPQPGAPAPPQPGPPAARQPAPAAAYPEPVWTPESGATPTAEDFARRRQARPADPMATMGVRAVVNRMGLVRLPPGRHEQDLKRDIEMVRRNFGGLRQVTVVNPKGGAGKTVAILLLAMTFGQKRGGYVLAWDNNETQGTLGMRAQQDFHSRTVRDMLRDLGQFQGPHGRIGDLSQYVRSQGEGMFDVLASDESATGGEMLTAAAFAEIREVVSRFYKLIFVDTGNNVRAQNWQAAMDATDQLVVTMSARNDSAETAARMLDHLEQSGRQRLVRQAVTVVSMPPSRKEIDLPAIQQHFAARTRAVLLAPYERLIDTGEPIRYAQLSSATRDAWLKIAAAVAEGL